MRQRPGDDHAQASKRLKSFRTVRHLEKSLYHSPDLVNLPVLDGDFRPLFSINVTYPKWEKGVDLGNKIKPKAVSSSPDVIVHAIDNDSNTIPTPTVRSNVTYTFVLTDPDATSRSDPTMAEMCHWIVAGIHLNTSSEGQVLNLPVELEAIVDAVGSHGSPPRRMGHNSGVEELMSYYAPAPPPKTGYHRYVFVILAPKSNEKRLRIDTELKKPKERPHWGYGKVGKGVRDWAKDNGLTPVGANFFYATNKKQ